MKDNLLNQSDSSDSVYLSLSEANSPELIKEPDEIGPQTKNKVNN